MGCLVNTGGDMKFLTRWLGVEAPGSRIGLRIARDFTYLGTRPAALHLTAEAVALALGANIEFRDDEQGIIECSFGLIEQRERLRFEITAIDATAMQIHAEASFPAVRHAPNESRALDAVTAYFVARGGVAR